MTLSLTIRALSGLFGLAAVNCGASAVDATARALHPLPTREGAAAPRVPAAATDHCDRGKSPTPALDAKHALIVGNAQGLELWAPDGGAHRMLSPGPALHPQRIGGEALLALDAQDGDLQLGAQLIRISLPDGARTTIAHLPAFACAGTAPEDSEPLGLDVQDGSDVVYDKDHHAVCLTLMDRNANMADLQLKVHVDLDSGAVQRWLTLGEQQCAAPPGVTTGDPSHEQWCQHTSVAPRATAAECLVDDCASSTQPAFDFDTRSGRVTRRGAKTPASARLRGEYGVELVSPSGRWLVLGGDIQEGDYMHRSLVLCDRATGALYPVLAEPGPWPAPLQAAAPGGAISLPQDGMADVIGESDVRWIAGDSAPEALIVDQLVIVPMRSSWSFEGELAN